MNNKAKEMFDDAKDKAEDVKEKAKEKGYEMKGAIKNEKRHMEEDEN